MERVTITIPIPSVGRFRMSWIYPVILLLLPSLIWICQDHSVWPWDQSWYGQVSADCWFWLGHSFRQWIVAMADELNMKPPGISWLGQVFIPLRSVFGSVEAALLFSILLTQAALLALLFRIGEWLKPESRLVPLAGVVFASATQLFVGLSHEMLVEPMQAVAVAWTFYIALRSEDWPKARIIVHLGSALILGVLAKATTPLYCMLPLLYSIYCLVRRPGPAKFRGEWAIRSSRVLILVFGILILPTVLWYLRHLGEVWQHVRDASSSNIALQYGSRDSIAHKFVLWTQLLVQSFFSPYLSWGCLAAALAAIGWRRRSGGASKTKGALVSTPLVLSAVQIVLMLLTFSMNITVEPRYMFALLPGLAIVVMEVCASLPKKAVAVLLLLAAVQWGTVNGASLKLARPLSGQSQWLIPLHSDRSQYEELERVVGVTDRVGRYNIVAVEEPWLNANSAAFFAAKRSLQAGARGYYTSIGYAQDNIEAAMRRIQEFDPAYVITLDESHQARDPNFLNVVASPVLQRMRGDSRFSQVVFESKTGVVIFRFGSLASNSEPAKQPTPPSDGRTVPPALAKSKPRERGKSSLGWVNGKLPQEENGGRVFRVDGNVLRTCLGWAFDDGDNSTPEEIWIELTNLDTHQHYYWKATRYSRQELADALKLPSIRMAGMKCEEPGIRIPSGTYSTKIYQAARGGMIVSEANAYEPSPLVVVK